MVEYVQGRGNQMKGIKGEKERHVETEKKKKSVMRENGVSKGGDNGIIE